jgi:hypothetical protein
MRHSRGSVKRKVYTYEYTHKNTERFQVNYLIDHLKLWDKQEWAKPKINGRRELIKIRAEIKEIETKKDDTIGQWKTWFFQKTNQSDKPLAILTKRKQKKTQVN